MKELLLSVEKEEPERPALPRRLQCWPAGPSSRIVTWTPRTCSYPVSPGERAASVHQRARGVDSAGGLSWRGACAQIAVLIP